MPILLRFLAVPVIWFIVRRQRASRSAVIDEIEKLSLNQRLKLTWNLAKDERVPLLIRPLLILPAAYMASPIDVLPDFIPIVGKLDDAFVASTAYLLLARFVPPAVLREHVDLASR
jgi:uncharacterized membrane protein YkvA (DUF1232 family)